MNLLLDANILLNGLFIPYSQSRQVLEAIEGGSFRGFVCDDTISEVLAALTRARRNTGIDLSGAARSALGMLPIRRLPSVSAAELGNYKRIKGNGDRAIVATARKYGLTVCTNDSRDFRHAGEYGVAVATPEVLFKDGEPSLEKIVLGNLATVEQGTVYMVTAPSWVGMDITRSLNKRFYFFDTAGIGGLWYENSLRSLVYESDQGPRVQIPLGSLGRESLPLHTAVSYHCKKGVSLFFGYQGKKHTVETSWVPTPLLPGTRTYVGSDRHGSNQINGVISLFTSLPTHLTETGVNNLMNGLTVAHPWERLSVEDIIGFLFGAKGGE